MTVPATTRRAGPFDGNGSTTIFPFDFRVFAAADVQVTLASASGVETVQTATTDYAITINPDQDADPGGSITMVTAPAVGETLVITGAVPYDQTLDLPTGGRFAPRALENALDRTVIQVQQLAERLGRSLTLPATSAGADTELPAPEANKLIGWNSDATSLTNLDAFSLAAGIAYGNWTTERFSGTGSATTFTLASGPGNVHNCDVSISGVTQVGGVDFTLDGRVLTFTGAPPLGTNNIAVRYGQALPVGVVPTATTNWRVDTFTGDGATDTFTLSAEPFSANYTQVVVDGLTYTPGLDYTITGATITFTGAPPAATDSQANILVRYGREVTDSADASGIGYTAPSGLPRLVSERLAERVSVVDYGADPTGVADSTAAIQLAIDTTYARGGGEVWMPAGTYSFSSTLVLKRGVTLGGPPQMFGVGPLYQSNAEARFNGVAVLRPTAGVTGSAIVWDFSSLPKDQRPYGASLRDFILDCTNQGSGDGVLILKTNSGEGPFDSGTVFNRNYMERVSILRAPRYGINCDSTSTLRVNFGASTVRVGFSGSHGIYCRQAFDVSLEHVFSFANGGDGLYMSGSATERFMHCDFFNNQGNGATFDGFNSNVVLTSFDNNQKHGVEFLAVDTTITEKRSFFVLCNFGGNSRLTNGAYDNVNIGDRAGVGVGTLMFVGCKFGTGNTANPNKVRHQVFATSAPTQACNVMSGCVVANLDVVPGNLPFNDTAWSTFRFEGTLGPDSQVLSSRAFTLPAWSGSASPNILRGADFYRTANTASATLVGFSAGSTYSRGREVWVLIDDANTAVDFSGTNLKGNGGVDLAAGTSQGKMLHFKCIDGTNWAATIYG